MKKETCDKIWNELILPTYAQMQQTNGGLLCPSCEKVEFKIHYDDIVRHAKEQYMANSLGVLNRHKVAAAVMIAILKTKPIKKIDSMYYAEDAKGNLVHWPFNESLAITVALSILRAFILVRVEYAFSGKKVSKDIFCDVIKEDSEIFKNDIPISEQEREDWEWELYQVRQDGAYNLLSISHILKEIEKNCRLQYLLDNGIKPTHPDKDNLTEENIDMITIDKLFE